MEFVGALYVKYQDDLRAVRDQQRTFLEQRGKSMKRSSTTTRPRSPICCSANAAPRPWSR
ncbi:hypothetical protein AB0I99_18550 [Streptomyces spongiicola]|uniref:hypothetical protein n=1 Tax=Streptomyces spongiicola TaxID=1690221 RepID=UPI0034034D1D